MMNIRFISILINRMFPTIRVFQREIPEEKNFFAHAIEKNNTITFARRTVIS